MCKDPWCSSSGYCSCPEPEEASWLGCIVGGAVFVFMAACLVGVAL